MKHQFGNISSVATIDLDLGISASKLQRILDKQTWEGNPQNRQAMWKPYAHPKLQEIHAYLSAPEFRRPLLEHLYSLDHNLTYFGQDRRDLKWLWNGCDAARMDEICGFEVYFVRDAPNWQTHVHIDRIGHPFVGIIHLNEENQLFRTEFADNPQLDNRFTVPHGYGQGWMQANHVNTWHNGANRHPTEYRYGIMMNWGFVPSL